MSEPIRDAETAVRELGALPVPVGVKPLAAEGRARTMLDHAREALNARMTKDDLRLVLENTITYAASLEARASRYRIAWRAARTRAISTGGAADRYAARARDAQEALQHMLFTVIAGQMALKVATDEAAELRAKLAEYERPADEDPIRYALTEQAAEASPAAFRIVVDLENADDYDDAVYAAEQAQSALRGQGYKNVAVVDTEGERLKSQLEAVRAVHVKHADSEHCQHDGERWPCPTMAALGETGGV